MNVFSPYLSALRARLHHLSVATHEDKADEVVLGDEELIVPEGEQGPVVSSLSLALYQLGLIKHLPEPPIVSEAEENKPQ
ncbi:MAG TPA: hypothetical protein VFA07_05120 [Chthonomonadaceae bacterium]|nr:hypothetical protein [Chthonomonadaceae bacterium]